MGSGRTSATIRVASCLILAALAGTSAKADTKTHWRHDPDTPGDWFEPGNWRNGVPQADDAAFIDNRGVAQILNSTAYCSSLYLGRDSSESGAIELGGTGQLSADSEYIGYNGTGWFEQTGGSNMAGYLSVNAKSQYRFTAGVLQITAGGGLTVEGTLDFDGGPAMIIAGDNTLVNLSGQILNASQASLDVGSDSLTIFAPGFDPGTEFASFSTAGMVHVAGTELVLTADQTVEGCGTIDDHVRCQGTIIATQGKGIDLRGGVTVYEGGNVDLGLSGGRLIADSGLSACSGGQLSAHRLYLGRVEGSDGAFQLSGDAQVMAVNEYIGYRGTGQFVQSGGTNLSGNALFVGGCNTHRAVGDGLYELSGAGELSAGFEAIGDHGTGRFIQTGGTNTVGFLLRLGGSEDGRGTYELGGSGQLFAEVELVGIHGIGRFIQTGGINTITGSGLFSGLFIDGPTEPGTYELSGGAVSCADEYVGTSGSGRFVQSGGTNTVHCLYVGNNAGSDGVYELSGTGELVAEYEYVGFGSELVGYGGTGLFQQTGGSNTVGYLHIGSKGQYVFTGGNLRITGELSVDDGGRFISQGNLSTNNLDVGSGSSLEVTASTEVIISNRLCFEEGSTLTAEPGATIHMTGSEFGNESTDPEALAGLNDLALIFEGGPQDFDPMEVGGLDLGALLEGFEGNFALGGLKLGGADIGQVRLIDDCDNQPGGQGSEALYVWDLEIGPSSYLDLGGLNLYYRQGTIDTGATIVGGSPTLVPEPSAVGLAALAILLSTVWTRRRRP